MGRSSGAQASSRTQRATSFCAEAARQSSTVALPNGSTLPDKHQVHQFYRVAGELPLDNLQAFKRSKRSIQPLLQYLRVIGFFQQTVSKFVVRRYSKTRCSASFPKRLADGRLFDRQSPYAVRKCCGGRKNTKSLNKASLSGIEKNLSTCSQSACQLEHRKVKSESIDMHHRMARIRSISDCLSRQRLGNMVSHTAGDNIFMSAQVSARLLSEIHHWNPLNTVE